MKLSAHYSQPTDPQSFDEAYFKTHLLLIIKVPGLQSVTVTRADHTYAGEGFSLMAEMAFADLVGPKAAMRGPEMAAAGKNMDSFARGSLSPLAGRAEPWSG